jgi:uncharacterized YccA/Bax inhibitor family protein
MMSRSGNPVLGEGTFEGARARAFAPAGEGMTLQGTALKTLVLLLLAVASGSVLWAQVLAGDAAGAWPWTIGGMIASFVLALVLRFKMHWAPFLAPGYALAQGLFLGALSAVFEQRYPGIALQAVLATGGTLVAVLFAYVARVVRPSQNFRLVLIACTGGIGLVYLAGFIGSFFGWGIPYIHDSGPIGIGFSLVVVVVAALNLVLDFDYIEHACAAGADKRLEWYGAFALMVTLAWLYVEMLKLLAKLRRRN